MSQIKCVHAGVLVCVRVCEVKLEKLGKALEKAHEDPEVGTYTPAAELLEGGPGTLAAWD